MFSTTAGAHLICPDRFVDVLVSLQRKSALVYLFAQKSEQSWRKLYEFISQKKTQNNDERKSECIAIPKQTTTNDDDDDDDDDDDNNNNNNNNNNTKFI